MARHDVPGRRIFYYRPAPHGPEGSEWTTDRGRCAISGDRLWYRCDRESGPRKFLQSGPFVWAAYRTS